MITFTARGKSVVLTLCFDKNAQKYRIVNFGERTIAAQLYDAPSDAISVLRDLEKQGKITQLKIFDEL